MADAGKKEEKKEEPKGAGGEKKGKKKDEEEEMSPEDIALQEQIELYVTRTSDPELSLRQAALDGMVKEIRTATSSMTSVPKPLKFLRPHYATLKATYAAMAVDVTKPLLADVLSLLVASPQPKPFDLAAPAAGHARTHTHRLVIARRAEED